MSSSIRFCSCGSVDRGAFCCSSCWRYSWALSRSAVLDGQLLLQVQVAELGQHLALA